jgi:hypothetical protein
MAEAVHPRILPLSVLGLEPEDVDSDVDVVDVDQADLCGAFALAATVAPASGYEVEFFTGQLDRVGKLFHIVHVTLLGC